jgi:hypothetical protein
MRFSESVPRAEPENFEQQQQGLRMKNERNDSARIAEVSATQSRLHFNIRNACSMFFGADTW